jgi:pyruvate/2-oxoglutarate dehydrogenase complex dihydrolipoamide acyltransferase (E2) component
MKDVTMPKFGMSMTEGELVKWLVNVGDHVEKGDPVCEISSEKIANTLESFFGGTVKEILHNEGDIVAVGEAIARIEED